MTSPPPLTEMTSRPVSSRSAVRRRPSPSGLNLAAGLLYAVSALTAAGGIAWCGAVLADEPHVAPLFSREVWLSLGIVGHAIGAAVCLVLAELARAVSRM